MCNIASSFAWQVTEFRLEPGQPETGASCLTGDPEYMHGAIAVDGEIAAVSGWEGKSPLRYEPVHVKVIRGGLTLFAP